MGKKQNKWFYFFLKRLFDIFVSSFFILILSPLFIILSLMVKLTSSGEVFFKDKRVGKNFKTIIVLKYRTMFKDAEERLDKYLTAEQKIEWEKERKIDNDPRITKIGKILRKTSLDELPQLFNILRGDMSFIGPRPITKSEVNLYFSKKEQFTLLSVKPGLLGNWAVNGRSGVTFASGERQKMELIYAAKKSIFLDIKIMLKAVPAILFKKGAQ